MKYTNEIIIEKPIDEVIRLFDSTENMYHWMEGLESHEHLDGIPGEVGARMLLRFRMGKNRMEMTETILEKDLPDVYTGKYESVFSDNTVRNRFIDLGDGRTRMISETTVEPNRFMVRLMSWIMPGAFKKQSGKFMSGFKHFAEGREA